MPGNQLMTALTAAWAALHTFQFGLAIAGLNGIQGAFTCADTGGAPTEPGGCIPMSPAQFGMVTSIFTLGGLLGALASHLAHVRLGHVSTLHVSACFVLAGSAQLGDASRVGHAILGRVATGVGAGLATTTVPHVLAAIAPHNMKRALGVLNQLFIVFGILVGQALSFPFGRERLWRFVPGISVVVAIVQLGVGMWLLPNGSEANLELYKQNDIVGVEEEEALLENVEERDDGKPPLTIVQLFTTGDSCVRCAFPLVLITQFAQQVCGVSAVMYFSTSILSPVFPGSAKVVALVVVLLKIPATIAPMFMIERAGTRPLLLYPTATMVVCLLALGLGINTGSGLLSAGGMIGFVVAFSVGLGPVTWVVLSEVMPVQARAAASAVGLAVNWSTAFVVGATFLPLQQRLAGASKAQEGNIFFLFAATCALAVYGIRWGYTLYARVEHLREP